ncbi:MAG: hypothetical protein LBD37_01265 [Treponema sp.]|jgi:hypothetical protein|nr:hypothetical protein [Treponema sp.]
MKDKAGQGGGKGEPCDFSQDFKVLSSGEKRGILRTAKTLLKVQAENTALLAGAGPSSISTRGHGGQESARGTARGMFDYSSSGCPPQEARFP